MEVTTHSFNGSKWMETLPPEVKTRPINQIFMPGTHNSGTYAIKTGLLPLECSWLKVAEFVSCIPCVNNIICDTMGFQELTMKQQLQVGIRYFDIRYSFSTYNNSLFASHQFAGGRIIDIFNEAISFLRDNIQEVIILRLTRDQYHDHNKHGQDEKIQQLVLEIFNDILVQKQETFDQLSLANMALSNTRVIVIFDEAYENLNENFWPGESKKIPFTSFSNPSDKLISLQDDVREIEAKNNRFNGIQFTLTPRTNDYFSNSGYSSLKEWRQSMQMNLSEFLKTEENRMMEKNICVLTTDYLKKEFVVTIINLNFKRLNSLNI